PHLPPRLQVAAVTEHGRALLQRVRGGKLRTEKGLSLLELRAQALVQYLQDLGLVLGAKARGGPLGGLPALPRLLETRVVLEKLRPIEHRLKYQVEKLLRAAMTGAPGAEHPLAFHPEPSNLAEEPEAAPLKAPGLGGGRRYVPPHIIPVQYDSVGREQRAQEAAQRRALSSSVLRELRDELSDAPRSCGAAGGGGERPHRGDVERTRLEESLLLRLSESRQARAARRRRQRMTSSGGGALAAITHFGASAALWEPPNQEALPAKRRKKAAFPSAALNPPIKTHLHLIYIVKSLIDPCKGAPNMAAPSGGRHLAPRVDPT
ncbi:LOW QUALITY PROTEIN: neuroguidin-like, partial [Pezoporus wallicus]|uniref:LOW QUALITY PROTEIN: neuroguidin-like n=1 Tax=Pezoporus wallicus TaxID=35540 RepID=UPI00254E0FC0